MGIYRDRPSIAPASIAALPSGASRAIVAFISFFVIIPRNCASVCTFFCEHERATREREHPKHHATPESLGSAPGLSRAAGMRLIEKMEEQELTETRGVELRLTAEGEHGAVHIVRAHRLRKQDLADEARMPLAHVHTKV
jgi:hypothetical protein